VKYKPYRVTWRDACYQEGQTDADDLPRLSILQTVGFLIREGKGRVTIAREHSTNSGLRGVISIPRENIVSMKRLH
jgi:hypothetical protein